MGLFDDIPDEAGRAAAPAAGASKGLFDDIPDARAPPPASSAASPETVAVPRSIWQSFVDHIGGNGKTGAFLSEDKQGNVGAGPLLKPLEAAPKLIQRGYRLSGDQVSSEDEMGDVAAIHNAADVAPAAMPVTNFPNASRQAVQRALAADVKSAADPALAQYGPQHGPSGLEKVAGLSRVPATDREKLIQDATDLGVQLPYAATKGPIVQNIAGGVGVTPPGYPIAKASARAIDQMGQAVKDVSETMGSGGVESAGEGVKSGVTGWIKKDLPAANASAYAELDQVLGKAGAKVEVNLSETKKVAQELGRLDQVSASEEGRKALSAVSEALSRRNGLTYEGVKELRTRIFDRIDAGLEPGVSERIMRRIYSALGDDLRSTVEIAGAKSGGKAKAIAAFEAANTAAAEGFAKRESLLKVIGSEGKDSAEAVAERLLRMANAKSGADIERLGQAQSVMGKDAWDELGSALLARMGQTKDGFSIAQWRTAYNNMSEAGKEKLFGASKEKLDKIFGVGASVEQLSKWGNPSGSARVGLTVGAAAHAALNPASVPPMMALAAGDHMIARWLARVAKPGKEGSPVADALTSTAERRGAGQSAVTNAMSPAVRSTPDGRDGGNAMIQAPGTLQKLREGSTAKNPKTGARVILRDGEWVPLHA